ncbi:DUF5011 domain-containing protein, partial [Verrucomicrobia bacterium]|nr:DUF5011 domain-containing protein [Verrucomicrobiota bacterium]
FEGKLSAEITGAVDEDALGSYTLTYNASDTTGNEAMAVTRTVHVVDLTPPVITLVGEDTVYHALGTPYEDGGATANDSVDGNVSVTTSGEVNVNTSGTYTLTYNASDAAGNAATPVTRTVMVSDRTAPVITLLGEASVSHQVGTPYTDAGATASDSVDGNVSVTTSGEVNVKIRYLHIDLQCHRRRGQYIQHDQGSLCWACHQFEPRVCFWSARY